ncbi:MAG: PAS domain S-box protein, partial [Proteobacteria bacterium]|nr:PAS domain S-box protein [Pseudomonadota bacterium]
MDKTAQEKFNQLRRHAETLMKGKKDFPSREDADNPLKLIHELQTTQIELELQAEQLRQSEQELMTSKMRYTALYDFAPMGYISLDRKGVILEANLTFADMLAVERASLIGRPVSKHIVFDDQDIFHLHLKTVSQLHPKQICELQMHTADGSPLEVHFETTMVLNDAQDPAQYRTIILDISHRKRTEAALQKSEIKYRSMMESMTDPVYICSPDFTMEYANPAMIKRLGRDATGETCHGALHGLDHRCPWCVFDKVAAGNSIETTIVSPFDGRNYRVTNMPIQNQNGTVSKMSIFRDITDYLAAVVEKNKVLSQLRQSQKMESIGSLAGGIAHDFNNILHPILGFAEMSLEDLPKNHPVRENLEDIIQGAKRARDLVKQILSFSSQRETEQKPLLLKPLIQEALKLIRASIPANIEILQELYDTPDHVWANPTEIHELVLNLCTNAYHAMEQSGGTLWVRLDPAVPSPDLTLPPGDYCCLCISDTGMGIPPEKIEKIFDPYFTTKTLGKGSGLGLSVVHGIVKKYRGAIGVESIVGKGT